MEHGGGQPSITDLFWPAANFTLFAALMVRFLVAPCREFFRARTERLRDALDAGAKARREAQALKAQIEQDLAALPVLRERIKADLLAGAEHQRMQLHEAGQRAADHIRSDARQVSEQEYAAARQTLRGELVAEAVRQAVELVRKSAKPEDQDRFVRDFVHAVEAGS